MTPTFSRDNRDRFWDQLTHRFPRVPANWSITDGQRTQGQSHHGTSILSCCFIDDSRVAIAGGGRIPGCDSKIRIWDLKTNSERIVCDGHVCGIYNLAIDPRTGFLASASEDYSVFLWNLEKRDVVFLVGDNGPIVKQYVAFASGSAKIAIGEGETYDENSSVFVIDLDTGKEIFRQRLKENDCVCGLALSADGTSLVYGTAPWGGGRGDAVLHRLNLTEQRENWNVVFENAHFNQILFCRGEQQLIATAMLEKDDFESAVYVIDATSGEVESTYSSKDISLSIALSPTENLIACAHDGGQVELMRLPNFLLEKRLVEQPGEREGLCCVTFSPDSKLVVVGGAMPQLRVLER